MKRTILCLFALIVISGFVTAQTSIDGLSPKTAKGMGMGGASVVFSTGYETLFGNPAGLSSARGALTIADLAAWAYIKPTQATIDKVELLTDSATSDVEKGSIVYDLQAENNGLGAGVSVGLGWTGKGFGLGFTLVSDNYTSAMNLKVQTQANAVVGLAFPIKLGPLTFRIGADGRVFLRTDSDGYWSVSELMAPSFSPEELPIIQGYGFAVDAGAVLEFGPLRVGAAVRDFGLEFNVGNGTVQDIKNLNIPLVGTTPYVLSPKVYVGAGLQFGGNLLASSLFAETNDIEAVIVDYNNIWMNLHAGAEVKLLNFIKVRGGINKGYYSLGAGIDFLFLEVDAAVFTEEVGLYPGHRPRSGVAIQTAIRF